jgi:hypothetical protein
MSLNIDTFKEQLRTVDDTTVETLSELVYAERKFRYDRKQQELSLQWRLGDTVYFVHRGRNHQATIKRLNKKTISAIETGAAGQTRWKLAYSVCFKNEVDATANYNK